MKQSTTTNLTFTPEVDKKAGIALAMVYPVKWMKEKAAKMILNDGQNLKLKSRFVQLFPSPTSTAGIRAPRLRHAQATIHGSFSQMAAGLTHAVQPERLRHSFQSIQKAAIVTGDEDNLIHFSNAYRLKEAMSEAELVQFCIRCQCRNSGE
ncbi:hypothetical protein M378DRAFT_435659 [Amanita muscaria Koide BX008]|uniref:Uncharacterized protein n=1 Tax=Amanita muscaria (strain Koide BX008) TaxID=946122 RepID=A0A0C2W6U8_AMAMK|nr:hypothetical protein M378DRAFT_584853 [Amanita muscaria Koide BX008]KIL56872.1 hypothetical protein M378DRAFT_435659 [Amanita muscaria Koide BX008]